LLLNFSRSCFKMLGLCSVLQVQISIA
jgi:hypothetical protein